MLHGMKTTQHAGTPWTLLGAALLVPLALQFAALVLPWERVWGIDALRYLPPATPIALLIALPLLYFALRALEVDFLRGPVSWLLAILALAPLLLWPVQTYFYGDGGLLIPQIHRFSVDGGHDTALLANLKSAPLAGGLLLLTMHAGPALGEAIPALMPADALYPFRWMAVLSVLAAAGYIIRTARGTHRLTLLVALSGTAGALHFAGHVEYYAPVFAALTVFVLAGERAVTGKSARWPAVLAFAVACAAHYMTLALLPSLLFLLAHRGDATRRRIPALRAVDLRGGLAAGGIIISGWIILYILLGLHDSPNRAVMPVVAQRSPAGVQAYTLLSSWHLADLFNLLLLLSPAALLALGGSWFARWKARKFGDGTDAFHALNVLLFAGFAVFANTTLGLGRDWDLVSPLGMLILLAAISALRRRHDDRAGLALALISVLAVAPWMQLHRDAEATAARFERVLALDAAHMYGDYALSGYDALRKYRHRAGDLEAEIRLTKEMITLRDYPQHYRELAQLGQRMHASAPGQTVALQRWMLDRLTSGPRGLATSAARDIAALSIRAIDSLAQGIGFLALGNGTYADLRDQIDGIAAMTRDGRPFPAITGLAYSRQHAYDLAAERFEAALREGFDPPALYLLLGNALALARRYSESLARFEEGVRAHPDDAMLRFTLGKYYFRAGIQPERSAELLRWCLTRGEPAVHLREADAMLLQLRGRGR